MRATEHSVSCQNPQGWNEIPFGLVAETAFGLSSPTYSQRHTSGCLPELSLGDGQGKAQPPF